MVWSDRGYARFGVGFADPWSDLRLARFALAVPAQVLTVPGVVDKPLALAAMRGIMPESVRTAVAKIVPSPFYEQALQGPAATTLRGLVTGTACAARGWIDEAPLRAHAEDVIMGGPPSPELWHAVTLELWLRRFWS
jgi:asparagine synthase (glutamine-hydrolysing)